MPMPLSGDRCVTRLDRQCRKYKGNIHADDRQRCGHGAGPPGFSYRLKTRSVGNLRGLDQDFRAGNSRIGSRWSDATPRGSAPPMVRRCSLVKARTGAMSAASFHEELQRDDLAIVDRGVQPLGETGVQLLTSQRKLLDLLGGGKGRDAINPRLQHAGRRCDFQNFSTGVLLIVRRVLMARRLCGCRSGRKSHQTSVS